MRLSASVRLGAFLRKGRADVRQDLLTRQLNMPGTPDADERPSTPVTRQDYESSKTGSASRGESELPGGDAG